MTVRASPLTERQYTDIMLMTGADHVAAAFGGDAIVLLAIPALWLVGVIVFVALKLRAR
jgi:hypothetical protein